MRPGGRLTLGIGWSAEEFAALGVPLAHPLPQAVRVNPKPVSQRIPIVLGGNSDPAVRRAAAFGDGWYGFNLPADEVAGRVETPAGYCQEYGRDPAELELAVALSEPDPGLLPGLAAAGVREFVAVPPENSGPCPPGSADWPTSGAPDTSSDRRPRPRLRTASIKWDIIHSMGPLLAALAMRTTSDASMSVDSYVLSPDIHTS